MIREQSLRVAVIYGVGYWESLLLERVYESYSSELLEYRSSLRNDQLHQWSQQQQIKNLKFNTKLFGYMSSVNVGRKHFVFYEDHDVDKSMHRRKSMNAILYCDCVLFVVDCHRYLSGNDNLADYYLKKLLLMKKFNVSQLLIALDQIDCKQSTNEQLDLFTKIKQSTIKLCRQIRYRPAKLSFVPISLIDKKNILRNETNRFDWFSDETLLQALEQFEPIKRPESLNVRLFKTSRIEESELIYGQLNETTLELFGIYNNSLTFVNYGKVVEGVEAHRAMYENKEMILVSRADLFNLNLWCELTVEIVIFPQINVRLATDVLYDFESLVCSFSGIIKKIERKFDLVTDLELFGDIRHLNKGEYCYANLRLSNGIQIDLFADYPLLGNFILKHGYYSIPVFVRDRSLPNRFESEKTEFKLCTNITSVDCLATIEKPTFEHILIALANRNEIAFKMYSMKFLKQNFRLSNTETIHELWRLIPLDKKEPFLSLMIAVTKSGKREHQQQVIREYLLDYMSVRMNQYKIVCDEMFQNGELYAKLLTKQMYDEGMRLVTTKYRDFSFFGKTIKRSMIFDWNCALIKQLLDREDQLELIDRCESFLELNVERNPLINMLFRLDDTSMFMIFLRMKEFSVSDLIKWGRCRGGPSILRLLLRRYPMIYLESTKNVKYLKFINSHCLIEHYGIFKRDFSMEFRETKSVKRVLNVINRFCLCLLYHDPKYLWKDDRLVQTLKREYLTYPEIRQALDCFANFLEASFYRNNHQNYYLENNLRTEFICEALLDKYAKLNVKICSKPDCSVTLLKIFKESETIRLVNECYSHSIRAFTLDDIEDLLENRYCAIYVYYFYQLFMVGVEMLRQCARYPFLLRDLVSGISLTNYKDILFCKNAEDFFLFN